MTSIEYALSKNETFLTFFGKISMKMMYGIGIKPENNRQEK